MTGGQKLMAVCVFAGYTALFVSVVWPRVARRIRANQVAVESARRERIRAELLLLLLEIGSDE
jgi:hypothetical protein